MGASAEKRRLQGTFLKTAEVASHGFLGLKEEIMNHLAQQLLTPK